LLRKRGYQIHIAHDGPEALERASALELDAAVVDLGLPVMDGCEVALRLRERHGATLRLIALTGYGQPRDRERTQAAGFDAHLVKPVDPGELEAALMERLPATRTHDA
jgi:CheY-like chemotaxis protein